MKYPYENPLELRFSTQTYEITLPKGTYILEAYGASGGGDPSRYTTARNKAASQCMYTDDEVDSKYKGNTHCVNQYSTPGAGAYVKGKLNLNKKTTLFVTTGGKGQYSTGTIPGGHNGGGKGYCSEPNPCSGSGGGATDFRVLKNSLFNRFLVAGAGGGSDNADPTGYTDDGSGGSGGLPGQGFWSAGTYQQGYEADTKSGFSFGYGQNFQSGEGYDHAGAGSGFYGGFSISSSNAGASGGSSFALKEGAEIPTGEIVVIDGSKKEVERGFYALTDKLEYYLTEVVFATGVWIGNGKARITYIVPNCLTCDHRQSKLDTFLKSLLFTLTCCPRSH